MKSFGFVVLAGAISVAAMGCGGKEMPTAEQKAKMNEVDASSNRAQKAIPAQSSSTPTLALMSGAVGVARTGSTADFVKLIERTISNSDSDLNDAQARMTSRVQEALDDGDCKLSKSGLDGVTDGQVNPNISGTLEVSGSKCPVSFSMSVSSNVNAGSSAAVSFSIAYSVKDETYRAMNDVDSVTLSFDLSASAGSDSVSINANIDGTTHSQKYGDVKLSGKGTGGGSRDGGSFEFNIKESFPDFTVDFGIKVEGGSGGSSTSYSVNGNDVSKEEFESYAGNLGGAGGAATGNISGGSRS